MRDDPLRVVQAAVVREPEKGRILEPLEVARNDQLDQRVGDGGVELRPLVVVELVDGRRAASWGTAPARGPIRSRTAPRKAQS